MDLLNNINPVELTAVVAGIISVWLAKKENVWLYPVGLISVFLWIYLCWIGKLFGQSLINLFFLIMNFYGWYNWLSKDENNQPNVIIKHNNSKQNLIVLIVSTLLSFAVFYSLLPFQEKGALKEFVVIEAIITALNFVAMWLMAWKRVENWLLWIIGDIMCIPLFIHKDYPLGVIQFVVFIMMAYLGYREWRLKALKQ